MVNSNFRYIEVTVMPNSAPAKGRRFRILTPEKYSRGRVCFDPPPPKKVTFFNSKLLLDDSAVCKFHIIKGERLVSKMEGKTNF